MLTKNIATIEEHHFLADGRFNLSSIVMKRVRAILLRQATPDPDILRKFNISGDIPKHLLPKIVLEEFRTGKLSWRNNYIAKETNHDDIVYGE